MPNRPALVPQADILRAIRALKEAGHPHVRVVLMPGGVAVEPITEPITLDNAGAQRERERIFVA